MASQTNKPRDFLGIHFECCRVYARVYKNQSASAYEGRCPRCLAPIRVEIVAGGHSGRFFRAR